MRFIVFIAALAASALLQHEVSAQSFPSRPVTIVVPYPPGGLIDIVARILQTRYQVNF